jgi:hypothetical protein
MIFIRYYDVSGVLVARYAVFDSSLSNIVKVLLVSLYKNNPRLFFMHAHTYA